MLRFFATIAVILWIVVGVTALVSFAPTAVETTAHNKEEGCQSQQCNEKSPTSVVRSVFCDIGGFIDTYHDDITAAATVFIAGFTLTLWWSTRRLTEISLKQIGLARHELAMVHGPKLAVTRITEIVIVSGDAMSAVLDVVNYGSAVATIAASGGDIFTRPKTNYLPVRFDANITDVTTNAVLLPGMGYRFKITSLQTPSRQDATNIMEGTVDLCLVGHINYTDETGVLKLVNYFRVFDYKLGCTVGRRQPPNAANGNT